MKKALSTNTRCNFDTKKEHFEHFPEALFTSSLEELTSSKYISFQYPLFCHVRSQMKPSMRKGTYHLSLLLGQNNGYASVLSAACECAAG